MKTKTKSKAAEKATARAEMIEARLQELSMLTDKAAQSEAVNEYLQTLAKFYSYSVNNQFLIAMQAPHATKVAGYNAWKDKFNRQVKKGEKGIAILAPCVYNKPKKNPDLDDEGNEIKRAPFIAGFRVVYVFDVSQTEGDPLPDPPDWKSPEQNEKLQAALLQYCKDLSIEVEVKELQGNTQGYSAGKEIALAPTAGTKTLIHEIAHEITHRDKLFYMQKRDMELQAEAIAYCVATYFDMSPTGSPNYIALFQGDSEQIKKHADVIKKVTTTIIEAVEKIL